MNFSPSKKEVKENIKMKLSRYFGASPKEATREQVYKAVSMTVKDILTAKRGEFKEKVNEEGAKRVYYMSIEFLLGRSLKTNLCNLGLMDEYKDALAEYGVDLEDLFECEPDAGLGNGGLGRLAACFRDSLSSLDYPATGFSICYEYGFFKQMRVDGMQVELPDIWLPGGEVWLVPRTDRVYKVRMGGRVVEDWVDGHLNIRYEDCEEVEAVPYDMMISGADSKGVSRLRLWKARDIHNFNMGLFTQGQYTKAMEDSTNAEIISKVLYPSDNHTAGKLLRLSQQYFMVSASCQSIIRDHMAVYGTLDNFADKVAIHINDTHPALCIPELMRILIDDYFYSWDKAWEMVVKVCSYTNHTVMPEALEIWNEDLFGFKLPRLHMIIKEINERFCKEIWEHCMDWDKISRMSIIGYGQVRMANLSIVGSHSVNGVSKLHSDILKASTFKDFYSVYPERFGNVTNGIAHRRWLCYSNPKLAGLIEDCIGDGYRHDPEQLENLKAFADNSEVLERLRAIKHQNKIEFSNKLNAKSGILLNTHSIYDVQIKRLHEYKRQLLNALNIIGLYLDLKENPNMDFQPQTFIFGAKAAPGYHMAKRIIKLIYQIGKEISMDPQIREKLAVVFLENYNVSMAEALIPAAEISEQISMAGKEASGTGCMKLMINGAMTIGTLDGANVEMLDAVGEDNMYIFGLTSEEVNDIWLRGYNSTEFYNNNERLARIINKLNVGFAGESFADIARYLIANHGISDPYMCLADFESYRTTHERAIRDYANKEKWNRMSLNNIASAGYFTADRCMRDYAGNIWGLERLK